MIGPPQTRTSPSVSTPIGRRLLALSNAAGVLDHPWACAALVFLVAALVRGVFLWQIRDAPIFTMHMVDAATYHEWAKRIAAGDWIGSEVFYQAPLYPYFLAVLYKLFGDGLATVRIVQALIGSLSCALLAGAGRRFFSPAAGLVAGLLASFYAPGVFYDYLVQKSVLDMFFLSLSLYLLGGLVQRPSRSWPWWPLGMAMGALALTRENSLALVPILLFWLFRRRERHEPRLAAALLLGGLMMVLLPVAARNFAVGGGFHLTTSQFGTNFFIGNNLNAKGIYLPLLPDRSGPGYERVDAVALAEQAAGRRLTAGEVSSYWTGEALAFIREHPARWCALTARKLALAFNGAEINDGEDIYTFAGISPALRSLLWVFNFGVLVPAMVFGVWATWRERSRTWILLALGSAYLASLLLFYVFGRYRHPMAPFAILFAAAGLAAAPGVWRTVPRRRLLAPALAVAAAAVLCNLPLVDKSEMVSFTHYIVGRVLFERRDTAGAVEEYLAALRLKPDAATVHYSLGLARMKTGDPSGAADAFEEYLRLRPDDAVARGFMKFLRQQASAPAP